MNFSITQGCGKRQQIFTLVWVELNSWYDKYSQNPYGKPSQKKMAFFCQTGEGGCTPDTHLFWVIFE